MDPGGSVRLCQPSVRKCLLDPGLDPGLVFKGVSKYCINIWKTQVQYGVLSRNMSRKYMFCQKNRCAVKTRSTAWKMRADRKQFRAGFLL